MAINGEKEGKVIIALSQSAGRGRYDRKFYSDKGGIYMSILLRPQRQLNTAILTAATAVAVSDAIEEISDQTTQIKWVNDIYFDGKKVCGILTEAVGSHIIVGIGINVSTESFPEDIKDIAASVGNELTDRNVLIASVINNLEKLIEELPQRTFLEEYRELSLVLGKRITYIKNGIKCDGVAIDVDENGFLTVKKDDGTEEILSSGEISVRLN
jgi:BirA family biotin operon repressor/biotin-[acetyl-CoA-carboxylase] ligase